MEKHTGSPQQMRQGDLLFDPVETLPAGLEEIQNPVLAEGETTGHKHQVVATKAPAQGAAFRVYEDDKGNKYLEFLAPGQVKHEEHRPLFFPERSGYRVKRQRQYEWGKPRIIND